jgi:hypothetical protein
VGANGSQDETFISHVIWLRTIHASGVHYCEQLRHNSAWYLGRRKWPSPLLGNAMSDVNFDSVGTKQCCLLGQLPSRGGMGMIANGS